MHVTTKSGRKILLNTEAEDSTINQGIALDPDTYEVSDEDFRHLRPIGRSEAGVTKERISIRLSPEVVKYFRGSGKGWQTRVDEVLKDYISLH